jgi:hypothetical protein
MSVRIKYIKNPNGTYVTAHVFKLNGKEYRAHITDPKHGFISCLNNGQRIDVEASSMHKLKIELKYRLTRLGAKFESETRTSTSEEFED